MKWVSGSAQRYMAENLFRVAVSGGRFHTRFHGGFMGWASGPGFMGGFRGGFIGGFNGLFQGGGFIPRAWRPGFMAGFMPGFMSGFMLSFMCREGKPLTPLSTQSSNILAP